MPLIESAKKALRQDKRRTIVNRNIKEALRLALKEAREKRSSKSLSKAFSALDIAAKKNVIHRNKASRLKSRLTKFVKTKKKRKSVAVKSEKVKKSSTQLQKNKK